MSQAPDQLFLEFQRVLAGHYSLERELGRGGMGVVYLARDVALDRSVAIKLLPPILAAQPTFRERFLREARTAARLAHPHIVPIHTVVEKDGFVYFVMAYVAGRTLGQRVFQMDPPAGFAAQATSGAVIYASTKYGYPLSTTHVVSGAVMGAGATKRLSAVRWGVAGNIVFAWVLTLPAAALVAAGMWFVVEGIF